MGTELLKIRAVCENSNIASSAVTKYLLGYNISWWVPISGLIGSHNKN